MNSSLDSRDYVDSLVRSVLRGEIQLHELPHDLPPEAAAEVRRRAIEELRGVSLEHMGNYSLDAERASRRHCENFIGAAQVPIGIAGPVPIRGELAGEEIYVPMATTEGALLASVNRGCAAIRAAGGAIVQVEDVGMTRAPVFETTGLMQTERFLKWVREHEDDLRRVAESTSSYLRLLDVHPFAFGTTVFLRFRFETGDAMGMNMTTIACDRIVRELIEPETDVTCVALSGNYCVDKKLSSINFQQGRGKRIHCQVVLEDDVLKDCLRTTAKELAAVQYRKNLLGSIAAGAAGFNAHYANILAAIFIATGQDVAHVAEGSMGVTCMEQRESGGLVASVFLPDVPLGAIGGGTALETQQEALRLLGVVPDPKKPGKATVRLAQIVGATVLAGELSLMAAFTSWDLSAAHEKFARGKPSAK